MDNYIDQEKLNKIVELNKKLALEDDFNKKIELISDAIKNILKVDRCTIYLHDKTTKSLWSVYIDGVSYIEIPDDKGIAGEVFQTKKSIIVNDTKNSPYFNATIDQGSGYETKNLLTIPILGFGERILGVMQLINKLDGVGKFGEEDIQIISYIIAHISAFLEVMIQQR